MGGVKFVEKILYFVEGVFKGEGMLCCTTMCCICEEYAFFYRVADGIAQKCSAGGRSGGMAGLKSRASRSGSGVMSGESGVYEVGVLLQDAQELAGRAVRGADALLPVTHGRESQPQGAGKFGLTEP